MTMMSVENVGEDVDQERGCVESKEREENDPGGNQPQSGHRQLRFSDTLRPLTPRRARPSQSTSPLSHINSGFPIPS